MFRLAFSVAPTAALPHVDSRRRACIIIKRAPPIMPASDEFLLWHAAFLVEPILETIKHA
jgi:hypothetical protein